MNDKFEKDIKECIRLAEKEERKGIKHKGLLITKPDDIEARKYIKKARDSVHLCEIYRREGFEYKIPEEWFYILYYCALAILSKMGIETRSQKWTALFLKYIKEKGIINYDDEFIKRITVYKEKDETSDVDERERSRYGSEIKIENVEEKYESMKMLCLKAILQAEKIVYSSEPFVIPKELIE